MNKPRLERRNARLDAADAGLARLRAAEAAIEQAFSATADLAAELPRLRAHARLSTVVGHEAVDDVAITLGHLSAALGGIVRTHGNLARVGSSIGYRTRGTGDVDKPDEQPPKPPLGHAALNLVGDDAR